ncbi:hypothetical protein IMZ11_30020 [Microtetraspora sp. AC03309]|uniref:hypothetical protein n=1 Tax=Microtetraspora sp. AC03309 TaxID=2779376 RepID=UPI001E2CE44B|nr:hypothetical protein [Microtetraspora sp. AC03309]MCC5579868.1 hypothetical protein [Microtetraspora sp. AC03309]
MPKLKSVIAGLAISTAMTGGAVALGAATTTTAANAGVIQVGCGGGCGGGWGGCGGWGRGGRNHNRNFNRNHNRQHQRNHQNQRQQQRQNVINNIRIDRGRGFDDEF